MIAQMNNERRFPEKLLGDQHRMGYALWLRLSDISDLDAKLRTVLEGFDYSLLQRSKDDSDLSDTRRSHLVEPIHEHRLVCYGKHVLVPSVCQRTESRSMPSS